MEFDKLSMMNRNPLVPTENQMAARARAVAASNAAAVNKVSVLGESETLKLL